MEQALQLGNKAEPIYRDLLRKISSGELQPNRRMPTEQETADEYGVSRMTARKALQCLAEEGLIERRQGAGSFVAAQENDQATNKVVSIMYGQDMSRLPAIHDRVMRQGFILSFFSQYRTHWDPDLEALFLRQVAKQQHQALLAFCSPILHDNKHNEPLLREIEAAGVRVIHYHPFSLELPEQSYLMPDFAKAGYLAAVRLLMSGRRPAYFACMEHDGPAFHLMRQGFMEALRALGELDGDESRHFLEIPEYLEDPAHWAEAPVEKGAGIACGGYDRTRLVAEALQRDNLRLPEDVGLVAIEDPVECTPPVDSVDRVDFGGSQILNRVIDLATAPQFDGIHELIAPRLIKGDQ